MTFLCAKKYGVRRYKKYCAILFSLPFRHDLVSTMDGRPAFLGRGRGSGYKNHRPSSQQGSNFKHKKSSQSTTSASKTGHRVLTNSVPGTVEAPGLSDRHKKVEEIRQSVASFAEDTYLSSSDSDEDIHNDEILRNTLTSYQGMFISEMC